MIQLTCLRLPRAPIQGHQVIRVFHRVLDRWKEPVPRLGICCCCWPVRTPCGSGHHQASCQAKVRKSLLEFLRVPATKSLTDVWGICPCCPGTVNRVPLDLVCCCILYYARFTNSLIPRRAFTLSRQRNHRHCDDISSVRRSIPFLRRVLRTLVRCRRWRRVTNACAA